MTARIILIGLGTLFGIAGLCFGALVWRWHQGFKDFNWNDW